jgi:hypothetical protein
MNVLCDRCDAEMTVSRTSGVLTIEHADGSSEERQHPRIEVACTRCPQRHTFYDYGFGDGFESHSEINVMHSAHPAPTLQYQRFPIRLKEYERFQYIALAAGTITADECAKRISDARTDVSRWMSRINNSPAQRLRDSFGLWLEKTLPALFKRFGGRDWYWGSRVWPDEEPTAS